MARLNPIARLLGRSPSPDRDSAEIIIDGHTIPVILRRNRNARRLILRIGKTGDHIVITVPPGSGTGEALEFAARQAGWITTQMARGGTVITFGPGVLVPVRAIDHEIVHCPDRRGTVWVEPGETGRAMRLCVAGNSAHTGRRVTDWLRRQARADLSTAAQHYARAMGVSYAKITVRDQTTRWGSCSSNGALSFSWRLILAPDFVLDYVAAHEVAHLIEMNHSAQFWQLVENHCQRTGQARKWLKTCGHSLRRYTA